jgi:hypothetical protein
MWVWQWVHDPTRPLLMPEHYPLLIHSLRNLSELAQVEDDVDPVDAILDFFMQPKLISEILCLECGPTLVLTVREISECGPALIAILDCAAERLPTASVSEATRLIAILAAIADLESVPDRPVDGARRHFARNFVDLAAAPVFTAILRFRTCSAVLAAAADLFIAPQTLTAQVSRNLAAELAAFMLSSPDETVITHALRLTVKLSDESQKRLGPFLSRAFDRVHDQGDESFGEFLTIFPGITKNAEHMAKVQARLEEELQRLQAPKPSENHLAFVGTLFRALANDLPSQELDRKSPFWTVYNRFSDKITAIITETPLLLRSAFSFLKPFPNIIDFNFRLTMFQRHCRAGIRGDPRFLDIHRSQILFESRRFFEECPDAWLAPLKIHFINEDGIDMGGLLREWYTTIVKYLFDPRRGLFATSLNGQSYYPRGDFKIGQPGHDLQIFEFAGHVVARAVTNVVAVPANLTTSVLKRLLNRKLSLHDLEVIDPEKYNSLKATIENEGVEDWGLYFVTQIREGEERIDGARQIELRPGGRDILVTDSNKHEYVDLEAEFHLVEHMRDPLQAFCNGFHAIIPLEELTWFTPDELDLLICGKPKINVRELRESTRYENCNPTNPVVIMFWSVVEQMNPQLHRQLLMFVTASSQVPPGGFAQMSPSFKISMGKDAHRLPVAHTCFNQLDLQPYESKKQLRNKLLMAINEGMQFALR